MADLAYIQQAQEVKITGQDSTGDTVNYVSADANGNLLVKEAAGVGSQYRAQSITTTAGEALGGATILANRKLLHVTPTNGIIYWGYSNTVTIVTGTPIFPNNTLWLDITDNLHVWLISSATTDSRIGELS